MIIQTRLWLSLPEGFFHHLPHGYRMLKQCPLIYIPIQIFQMMRPFGTFTYITQGPTGLHPRLKKCVLNQTTTTYVHVRSQSCICHVYTYNIYEYIYVTTITCHVTEIEWRSTVRILINCHDFLSNKMHSHQNNYTLYLNSQHPCYLR